MVVKDQKNLVVRTPQQFKEMQNIDVLTEHRVTKIDLEEKKIEVVNLSKSETQWFSYDRLIIATGARSRRLNLPGNNASNIFTLKDLQDGIRIRNYVDEKKPKRVSVLGGGFIGLEDGLHPGPMWVWAGEDYPGAGPKDLHILVHPGPLIKIKRFKC